MALVYEDLTVSTSVVPFATDIDADPTLKGTYVTLDAAEIRYRVDGGDPSATSGHLMAIATQLWLTRAEAIAFKAIRSGGTDGKIRATHGLRPSKGNV